MELHCGFAPHSLTLQLYSARTDVAGASPMARLVQVSSGMLSASTCRTGIRRWVCVIDQPYEDQKKAPWMHMSGAGSHCSSSWS